MALRGDTIVGSVCVTLSDLAYNESIDLESHSIYLRAENMADKETRTTTLNGRLLRVGCAVFTFAIVEAVAVAQSLEERLSRETHQVLAADARRTGDPVRGATIFYARAMACSTCHSVGDRPETIGPDLTKLVAQTTDAALVEALLDPSATIAPAYATVTIATVDGKVVTGLPVEETADLLILRDATQPDRLISIKVKEIEERLVTKKSLMPSGQMNLLRDRQQFLDLVRYLIDIKEGGKDRARQLQPPPDSFALKIPDDPLPWQPIVQRGEITVEGNAKYPHGAALGFVGGTLVFDANQLATVATWQGGFVKKTPQNYFGLYWHRDGGPADMKTVASSPIQFQLSSDAAWETFEPAVSSDPNTGTRFEGYQIGRGSIRLRYRLRVGSFLIGVTENIRVESRPDWHGVAREFQFSGLPTGARVALSLNGKETVRYFDAQGLSTSDTNVRVAPLISDRADEVVRVIRATAESTAAWSITADGAQRKLIALASSQPEKLTTVRMDNWKYQGRRSEPKPTELANLVSNPPVLDTTFDQPRGPASLPPLPADKPASPVAILRPGVNPKENVDEFSPAKGKFLRFVVTHTTDDSEPGIDELEVYGADPNVNLALKGKASASTVISGYPIHQIPHLNDGKLGNNHSWISAERGGGWAQIEFTEPQEFRKIIWARDRTGQCRDRLPNAYRIEVSSDGQSWTKVGDESGRAAFENAIGAIRPDAGPGYVLESIPTPFPSCRPSDIAFGDDGTMYAIAMTEGQIWRTRTPPVGRPNQVQWQRYATGLYHPIGLAMVDGRLYVAQKPEITELIDRDGDGVVEQFRTVATGWGLSTGWHEYCFGLATDPQKNLWFTLNTGNFWTHPGLVSLGRWRGSVMRIAHESEKLEEMARGCRTPNGIGRGPNGDIFYTDNQGDWIQACKLAHVVPGRFYGHPETKADALPKETYPDGKSTVWLPYNLSRSSSGPVCDTTQGKFGPFADQMFVGDVGYGANPGILRVALEKVNGEYQGASFRFVDGQPLGCERMKFGPDNQLYMASLTSGLTRLAFDGKTPLAIESMRLRKGGAGFVVQLTKPLASETKLQPEKIRFKRYYFPYTSNYGANPTDEKVIPVEQAELSSDRKTITLTLPVEVHPNGMVYEMDLGLLSSETGEKLLHREAWYTVHALP